MASRAEISSEVLWDLSRSDSVDERTGIVTSGVSVTFSMEPGAGIGDNEFVFKDELKAVGGEIDRTFNTTYPRDFDELLPRTLPTIVDDERSEYENEQGAISGIGRIIMRNTKVGSAGSLVAGGSGVAAADAFLEGRNLAGIAFTVVALGGLVFGAGRSFTYQERDVREQVLSYRDQIRRNTILGVLRNSIQKKQAK